MSSYTSSLKLILPVTGEFPGTWGTDAINDQITSLVDVAVAGYTTVAWTTPGADQTLDNGNGSAANEARSMYLDITGAPGSALNVIAPTASKLYYIKNSTSGGFAITLKTSAGTGVSVPNGKAMVLVCDATNIVDAITAFSSVSIASTLDVTDGAVIQGLTVGQGAGSQVTTTAVGFEALGVNTSYDNTATGYRALYLNTGGNGNTAIGSEALRDTVGSSNNTAVGVSALAANTGSSNVALGARALQNNTTGTQNTAVGTEALLVNAAGSNQNTAIGNLALTANSSGAQNTAVGAFALQSNTTGAVNLALGRNAGSALTIGDNNTIIGSVAGTAGMADTVIIAAGTTERMRIDSLGNMGLGTTTPAAAAKLQVSSTTQGFLPPVMTTTQKNAIGSPTAGLIVFDTTLAKLCVYSGAAWQTITSV